jgi:hypothetical protein
MNPSIISDNEMAPKMSFPMPTPEDYLIEDMLDIEAEIRLEAAGEEDQLQGCDGGGVMAPGGEGGVGGGQVEGAGQEIRESHETYHSNSGSTRAANMKKYRQDQHKMNNARKSKLVRDCKDIPEMVFKGTFSVFRSISSISRSPLFSSTILLTKSWVLVVSIPPVQVLATGSRIWLTVSERWSSCPPPDEATGLVGGAPPVSIVHPL